MAKKNASSKNTSKSTKIAAGIGIGAAALAAIGGYFFYGSKNAKQNRKKAKSWMLRAKAEVLDGLEGAKQMSKEEYEDMVDRVAREYKKLRGVTSAEVKEFVKEMNDHWHDIERAGKKSVANVARSTARSVAPKKTPKKKATKKTTARKKR